MSQTLSQLEAFFPYRFAVAAERFSRNLMDVYGKSYGLSREEWRLLFLLSQAEEIASNELAQRTTLDKVQLSRASKRLADKGLITREVAANDRRLKLYKCTDKGRSLFEEIKPQVDARAHEILAAMDGDARVALQTGMRELLKALDAPEQGGEDQTAP
ncbi:MarR family winged helix-turn-helix transcriptional regulator [Pelagimonas varians]|uniref:Transcriptional regulator SlyA n=1 Tax=Pelagimonas varians TaxID=696760 RepID=A0A238K9M9_9RHOB|nr:MarR family transcriptional regulator [Pelagimonas varians]PYG31081.1 DNA-binding MarR family transcriptional regulator [Pelagimonas varians]SMX39598.1 Transcriptional regulator SlyA [Pelagimonas varians]